MPISPKAGEKWPNHFLSHSLIWDRVESGSRELGIYRKQIFCNIPITSGVCHLKRWGTDKIEQVLEISRWWWKMRKVTTCQGAGWTARVGKTGVAVGLIHKCTILSYFQQTADLNNFKSTWTCCSWSIFCRNKCTAAGCTAFPLMATQ